MKARGLNIRPGRYEESGLTGLQVLPDGTLSMAPPIRGVKAWQEAY